MMLTYALVKKNPLTTDTLLVIVCCSYAINKKCISASLPASFVADKGVSPQGIPKQKITYKL